MTISTPRLPLGRHLPDGTPCTLPVGSMLISSDPEEAAHDLALHLARHVQLGGGLVWAASLHPQDTPTGPAPVGWLAVGREATHDMLTFATAVAHARQVDPAMAAGAPIVIVVNNADALLAVEAAQLSALWLVEHGATANLHLIVVSQQPLCLPDALLTKIPTRIDLHPSSGRAHLLMSPGARRALVQLDLRADVAAGPAERPASTRLVAASGKLDLVE